MFVRFRFPAQRRSKRSRAKQPPKPDDVGLFFMPYRLQLVVATAPYPCARSALLANLLGIGPQGSIKLDAIARLEHMRLGTRETLAK